jgi:hypothetical protein
MNVRSMTDPIDSAYAALRLIRDDYLVAPQNVETEEDTRAQLIDRVLNEVLGWRQQQVARERNESGDRLDYRLSAQTEYAIVEAKRSAVDFGIPNSDARWYKRSGPVARAGALNDAIEQADRYATRWGCGLVCATTGLQWVLFLGSRTDGQSKEAGSILVFRSLDDLCDPPAFKLFYAVLAERHVRTGAFRHPFLVEEGTVQTPSRGTANRLVDVRGKDRQKKRSDLAKTLAPLLKEVFEGLSSSQNAGALRACFVETHQSIEANSRLERLTRELTEDIEPIDTRESGASKLTEILSTELRDEVSGAQTRSATVLLLGQHGSGKSTFIDSFFSDKLPKEIRNKCLVITVDLAKADPDPKSLPAYLKERTVEALEQALFGGESPTYDQLKGIFFSEYQALSRGPLKPLKEARSVEFDIEFGKRVEEYQRDREKYIKRLLENARKSHRKLVCLVFDNADHFDDSFQAAAFLQVQWTANLERMLILLPMRDTTYWRAREQSAFHAVRNTILYLPRPPLAKVLERRFEFAISELSRGDAASITSLKGFRVSIASASELLEALQRTFTKDLYVSRSMAMLAAGDIREALRLFEACVSSPHINLDKLLAAYLARGEYQIDRSSFERAVLLGDWEQFDQDRSRRVCNLLCCPRDASISPLLGFRILLRCYELRTLESSTKADKGFVALDDLLGFFSTLGVRRQDTDRAVGTLLYSGLLEPYDLGSLPPHFDGRSAAGVEFVKVTSSGLLHRDWLRTSKQYTLAMADDVEIFDESVLRNLRNHSDLRNQALRKKQHPEANREAVEIGTIVRDYVLHRDVELISIPSSDSPSMKTQATLKERVVTWLSDPGNSRNVSEVES